MESEKRSLKNSGEWYSMSHAERTAWEEAKWQSIVGMTITRVGSLGELYLRDTDGKEHELIFGSSELFTVDLDKNELAD